MSEISAVIVDDHKLFRKGLCMIINGLDNFKVVAEANDGQEFIDILENLKPDIVLMDIKMPKLDGIEATKLAIKKYPDLKIIALSMFGDIEYYNNMLEAGVKGFVLKNSDSEELIKALNAVLSGNSYFSQELLQNLVKSYQSGGKTEDQISLSKREVEVLQYICKGYSNSEIAKKMYISQRTVESHRANILSKTGAKNSISLVVYAIKNKLFTIN